LFPNAKFERNPKRNWKLRDFFRYLFLNDWGLYGIVGKPGSGKTLTLVFFMWLFDKLNYRFLTNVKTDFRNAREIEDIFEIVHEKYNNIRYVFFDELWLFLDSRRSTSRKNVDFSQFGLQLRKYRKHVFYTLQILSSLDLRLRNITIWYIIPDFNPLKHECTITIMDSNENIYGTITYNTTILYKHYNTYQRIEPK